MIDSNCWCLEHVSLQRRGVLVLQDVTLCVQTGERVALVGANGSGKSSLLRVLHGLLPATGGRFITRSGLRQALLFQHPHMLRCSAQNHVALGVWLAGQTWAVARAQAMSALARVGLAELADQRATTLSGGQKQRLALARAWARNPDVLLLDEPTASLDPGTQREVEHLIATWGSSEGEIPATLVLASHNLGQVKRLAQRVLYLEKGRVLVDLPVDEFFDMSALARRSPEAYAFVKGEIP